MLKKDKKELNLRKVTHVSRAETLKLMFLELI
jgi:hypothetical protein